MKKISLGLLVLSLSLVACAEDNQKAGASSATGPKKDLASDSVDAKASAESNSAASLPMSPAAPQTPVVNPLPGVTPVAASELGYTATIKDLEAGIDYPTDSPVPASLTRKKALLITSEKAGNLRFVVESNAVIAEPEAGIDYPTDSPNPLKGKKVLVLGTKRIVLNIVEAEAGIDYPTETAPAFAYVWAFSRTVRLPYKQLRGIVKAEAGVDYPTEVAADFYVALSFNGASIVRSPLK